MTRLIVDPEAVPEFRQAKSTVEVVDGAGRLLGHFVPALPAGKEPAISDEELHRREQRGGGRPLAQVLADLERRA